MKDKREYLGVVVWDFQREEDDSYGDGCLCQTSSLILYGLHLCYQGKCLCFSVQGYMRKYFNKTQKRNYCLLQQFEILPNIIL